MLSESKFIVESLPRRPGWIDEFFEPVEVEFIVLEDDDDADELEFVDDDEDIFDVDEFDFDDDDDDDDLDDDLDDDDLDDDDLDDDDFDSDDDLDDEDLDWDDE